jgi:xylulose-5-phosphate/fructose-6-phosphate phosphoketolase
VPLKPRADPAHLKLLEDWLRSYRPEELFDRQGRLRADIAALAPRGVRRMGANPHANGGLLLRNLRLPDFRDYAVDVSMPGAVIGEATKVLGAFLRDTITKNMRNRNFRIMAPDELTSNRLGAVLEVSARVWLAERDPDDDHLAPDGRSMEILSEHTCQGWLEGYLLTGRHGLFTTYEAFVHIDD